MPKKGKKKGEPGVNPPVGQAKPPGQGTSKRARQRRKARKVAAGGQKPAPVAGNMRKGGEAVGDRAQLVGTDRFLHIADVRNHADGHILVNQLIEPAMFPRFAKVASAFQKYRVAFMEFHVNSQVNINSSGGYVVAYVPDSSESWHGGNVRSRLTSMRGSLTKKWIESVKLKVPSSGWHFTQATGRDVRDDSPGRIVIVCDGKATQEGAVTITAHWKIELMGQSLEPRTLREIVVDYDLMYTKDKTGLNWIGPNKAASVDWLQIDPKAKDGDIYRLPAPIGYYSSAGGEFETFHWVIYKGVVAYLSSEWGKAFDKVWVHSNTAVARDSILIQERREKEAAAGEGLVGSSFQTLAPLETSSACYVTSRVPCPDSSNELIQSLTSKVDYLLKELSRLTACPQSSEASSVIERVPFSSLSSYETVDDRDT